MVTDGLRPRPAREMLKYKTCPSKFRDPLTFDKEVGHHEFRNISAY